MNPTSNETTNISLGKPLPIQTNNSPINEIQTENNANVEPIKSTPQTNSKNQTPSLTPPVRKLIFDFELAFTNYTKPNSPKSDERNEIVEDDTIAISSTLHSENLEVVSTERELAFDTSTNIEPISENNQISPISTQIISEDQTGSNQSGLSIDNLESNLIHSESLSNSSLDSMDQIDKQLHKHSTDSETQPSNPELSLYSIESLDLLNDDEMDELVSKPLIFQKKYITTQDIDSEDQVSDSKPSESTESEPTSTAKPKVPKKRKRQRKNYFAPPKRSKPKKPPVESPPMSVDDLDLITIENTQKNIISLRDKHYITITKRPSEKDSSESITNQSDNEHNQDNHISIESPKSQTIKWNDELLQYKEFRKGQSITLGERFCSPVKPKVKKPKKSCISKKAPFTSPQTVEEETSTPLSPVTVTRIVYSKK